MTGAPQLRTDEVLLRRLRFEHYVPENPTPSFDAFHPIKNDLEGIWLFREGFVTAEEVGAYGSMGKMFWIARLTVDKVHQAGAVLRADTEPPGHVTVTNLRYDNRRSDEAAELKQRLRSNCIEVVGPFRGTRVRH